MKIIIAGYPGVGKTTTTLNKGLLTRDMESSNFHWVTDGNGNKIPNPEWPGNYVQAIIDDAQYKNEAVGLYTLCSTHKDVLLELARRKIPFIIYAPATKEYAIGRYEARGNTPEFIEKLDKNWDTYMTDLDSYGMHVIRSDEYLSEFLEAAGTCESLAEIIKLIENGYNPLN